MRITVLDYGAGNLHSITKAVQGSGRTVRIASDPRAALDTDVLVLPGVGAFAPAAATLAPAREDMRDALRGGLPCLGICLGMQLLFEGSEEGVGAGIGLFAGRVTRLNAARLPQIGWNTVDEVHDAAVAAADLQDAYYANSFACRPDAPDVVTAWSTHERDRFPAVVRTARTLGVQFHPEKSSVAGILLIDSFLTSL